MTDDDDEDWWLMMYTYQIGELYHWKLNSSADKHLKKWTSSEGIKLLHLIEQWTENAMHV